MGKPHTREGLITLLWPELEPGRARANLRRNLSLTDAERERFGLGPR